ncbi:MAG TPA: phospholipase domain-containing protein, partial [Polyangiaceae bacterium]|nr:phospholipase domain-containing protein [Polyangiaceae bacterium]
LHLDRVPRRYTVGAGHELDGEWDTSADGGAYDLWVLGPNGFHRHFIGNVGRSRFRAAEPELRVEYDPRRDGLRLLLLNGGDEPCVFRLVANAYHPRWEPLFLRVAARDHREHMLHIKQSANWYDFTVRVAGFDSFVRRFAGRMENGRNSLSDPALGGRARGEQNS